MTTPVRFSHLKAMSLSAAHCKLALDTDSLWEPTAAMQLGTAVHAVLLETAPVIAFTGSVRRGKEWDAFKAAQADDAIILTATEHDKCMRMVDAVRANADALHLLSGIRERTIHFDLSGRACRATPDALDVVAGHLTDLKTTRTAHPSQFASQALRMHYHAQLAFYRAAVLQEYGAAPAAHIVAVESSAPYPVTIFSLTNRALDLGERCARLWLEQLIACERSGQWPGYVQSAVELDVPDDDVELTYADDEAEAAQ